MMKYALATAAKSTRSALLTFLTSTNSMTIYQLIEECQALQADALTPLTYGLHNTRENGEEA